MTKRLIAYFSASGTTAKVAKALAQAAQADLYEIRPENPYTAADLDWSNTHSRCSVEMGDRASRPAISGGVPNMADYDAVFIGFPIWWGREPSIVDTFLESYDFAGKTVTPFATSGGSGLGRTETELKALCGAAVWQRGKLLNGRQTPQALSAWVEGLAR